MPTNTSPFEFKFDRDRPPAELSEMSAEQWTVRTKAYFERNYEFLDDGSARPGILGAVHRAIEKHSVTPVAIKVIRSNNDQETIKLASQIIPQISVQRGLSHPHIV